MIRICPSILNANFDDLPNEIARVAATADLIHLDVMDNIFVPNFTFDFIPIFLFFFLGKISELSLLTLYLEYLFGNYNDDLTLVSRVYPYATITDKVKVLEHIKRMVETSEVKTVQDNKIFIKATTFCVHGDNKHALDILMYLNENLE